MTLEAEQLGTLVIGLVVLLGFISYFVRVAWNLSKVLAELTVVLTQLRTDFKTQDVDIRALEANDRQQDITLKDHTTKLEWLMKD